jgi:hypothetical protein
MIIVTWGMPTLAIAFIAVATPMRLAGHAEE